MKKSDVRKKDVSRKSLKQATARETFGNERMKYDCYDKCINDAWDLKPESMCSSVCGI